MKNRSLRNYFGGGLAGLASLFAGCDSMNSADSSSLHSGIYEGNVHCEISAASSQGTFSDSADSPWTESISKYGLPIINGRELMRGVSFDYNISGAQSRLNVDRVDSVDNGVVINVSGRGYSSIAGSEGAAYSTGTWNYRHPGGDSGRIRYSNSTMINIRSIAGDAVITSICEGNLFR